jgi:hypothetical protein
MGRLRIERYRTQVQALTSMFHKEYTEPYQAVKKISPPWIGG